MQRVWWINWILNLNQDKDYSILSDAILDWSFVLSWLAVTTNSVSAWRAIIKCTRTSTTPNETIWVTFENTGAVTIDTSWTKKVWIEIYQDNINSALLNTDANWVWIWEIKTWTVYPAWNYVPLASITAWAITDDRIFLTKKGFKVDWVIEQAKSNVIASATTVNLDNATWNYIEISWSTTINGFSSKQAWTIIIVKFLWAPTLTHNVTSFHLPTNLNITAVAWDTAIFASEWGLNWKCIAYQRDDWSSFVWLPVENTKTDFVFWENLWAWVPVRKGFASAVTISQLAWNWSSWWRTFFYDSTNYEVWQSFMATVNWTLDQIIVDLWKQWAPTQTATIKVYSDAWTTLIGTSTTTFSISTLAWNAPRTWTTFLFSGLNLTAWNTYYFKISFVTGSTSMSNYWMASLNTTSEYKFWTAYAVTSANAWSPLTWDLKFIVWMTWTELNSRVYKANASSIELSDLIWFTNESWNTWETHKVNTAWVATWLSWLTAWQKYLLSNTAWTISTLSWNYWTYVWYALSTTTLIIEKWEVAQQLVTWEWLLYESSSVVWTFWTTPIKVKEAQINFTWTYRIYFELYSLSSSYTAYAQIYKNGVAVWTLRSTTSTTAVWFTEDLSFTKWDDVQIFWYSNVSADWYILNFRIKWAIVSSRLWPIPT